MTYEERNIWWDAYCSALGGACANPDEYTHAGADARAAAIADLALARWREIRLNDEEVTP